MGRDEERVKEKRKHEIKMEEKKGGGGGGRGEGKQAGARFLLLKHCSPWSYLTWPAGASRV